MRLSTFHRAATNGSVNHCHAQQLSFNGEIRSTVLWANYLVNGDVVSDESDKYALYKYADKLDAISRDIGVLPFSEIQDATDARFNLGELELRDGMESTDELMAQDGVWVSAEVAVQILEALLQKIETEKFGSA
jgi:hypothetical protein